MKRTRTSEKNPGLFDGFPFILPMLLFLLGAIPSGVLAHENGVDPRLFPILDAYCQGVVTAGNTPGAAILIGRIRDNEPDQILYHKTFGTRDGSQAVTSDTLYDLASCTKASLTSTAASLLLGDGVISDEDYVVKYISGFDQNSKGDVKIKHLLTHTSGLAASTSVPSSPVRPNPDALITKICGLSKTYTTGASYVYSDLNFILMGRIVENASGECMHNFLKRRVFDEIGMIDTTFFPSTEQTARTAPTSRGRGIVHDPLAWYYTDYTAKLRACGNAGGFSTVLDESRLARLILHGGKLYGKQIITPAMVEKLTTRQISASIANRSYGWIILSAPPTARDPNNIAGNEAFSHSGYTGTYIWMDKYTKTYMILFANPVYPTDVAANRSAIGTLRSNVIDSLLNHLDIYNNVPESGFIVDNDDGAPNYTESGTWTTGSDAGYLSRAYRVGTAGAVGAYSDYHFNLTEGGLYRLSTWHVAATTRASSAPFVIHSRSGDSIVAVNQQKNTSQWVSLGMFNFDPGTNMVRINVEGATGGTEVVADALLVEAISLDFEVVVDNRDPGYHDTSNFFSSSSSPLRYGSDYRACNPGVEDAATWQLSLPRSGVWEIFEWHNGNSTRSPDVPHTIETAEGPRTVVVNQQLNSGQWNSLGRFSFRAGQGAVNLTSMNDGIVVADAVKARFIQEEVIVDNLDARFSATSGFFLSSASPLRYDASYRACLTGTGERAVWNLQLPFPGQWELFEWHNGNSTRAPDASFQIQHIRGTTAVGVNEQLNSGQWNSLGRYFFEAGSGKVSLGNESALTNCYVIADAIRAVYIGPEIPSAQNGFLIR